MTISELFREKRISQRSYHVCRGNKIEDLNELEKYLVENENFLKIHNCGKKSNSELIILCEEYRKSKTYQNKLNQLNLFSSNFPPLKNSQQKLINSLIAILTSNLSMRNENAIMEFIGEKLTIDIFVNKVYDNRAFKISKIRNAGKSSAEELEKYFNTIKSFVFIIYEN